MLHKTAGKSVGSLMQSSQCWEHMSLLGAIIRALERHAPSFRNGRKYSRYWARCLASGMSHILCMNVFGTVYKYLPAWVVEAFQA